jgi:hypothetical protein
MAAVRTGRRRGAGWRCELGSEMPNGEGSARGRLREAVRPGSSRAVGGNSLAVFAGSGSLTPMAHYQRTQPPAASSLPPAGPFLDAASIEAVARRVVELIHDEGGSPAARRLVDAATLAAELGVDRSWVYAHRTELGAIQLGTGSKPRLRFEPELARNVLAYSASKESQEPKTSAPTPSSGRRRQRRMGSDSGLLPIRGSVSAIDASRECS